MNDVCDAYETFEHKGFTVELHWDTDPMNPRTDYDNFGTMYCVHGRYTLGDADAYPPQDDDIVLPLYLYDHSGVTMNTTGFSCPWDSGQVGYIYVSRDQVRHEFNTKRITSKIIDRVKKLLVNEVETYDKYLRGECYGYIVRDEDGEEVDSCWGFDDEEYCREQAVSGIDYELRMHAPCEQLTLEIRGV
jgi:hypothetical protein